jgi:pimeloyl-ACP methyl ester carboxylesterase
VNLNLNSILDDVFNVITQDSVTIKVRRFKPYLKQFSHFNVNGTPVLLFPAVMSNMNQFNTQTPQDTPSLYSSLRPSTFADWARTDPVIDHDPAMYYSLAYFLWKLGFDPWLLNYRGTGIGAFKSESKSNNVCLDTWALLDATAAIELVYNLTKKKLIIGGHSTGGFVCYAYLQGAYFEKGNGSHVRSDPNLLSYRNSLIKGVIAIDPATEPPPRNYNAPKEGRVKSPRTKKHPIKNTAAYLDIRSLVLDPLLKISGNNFLNLPSILSKISSIIEASTGKYSDISTTALNLSNFPIELSDFSSKWVVDNFYSYNFAQLNDFGMYQTIREFWKNGPENIKLTEAPPPSPGKDGYYYYEENMKNISVPFISFASTAKESTRAISIDEKIVRSKTHNPLDEFHKMEECGHIDIISGYTTPTQLFPLIGEWLKRLP